jgi:hypothetical protein
MSLHIVTSSQSNLAKAQNLLGLNNDFRCGRPVFEKDSLFRHSPDAGGFCAHHL